MDSRVRVVARVAIFPPIILFSLMACENTLFYGDRTGFNLSIHVNDDPTTPLRVNAGLERSAVAFVPPTHSSDEADGEAVNLYSGFKLLYTEEPTAFSDTLTIRTQFASGAAALKIAEGDKTALAVSQIVQSGTFGRDDASKTIMCWVDADSTLTEDRVREITTWIEGQNLNTEYWIFVDAKEFANHRRLLIREKEEIICNE
jgi:hypothetical protein